MTVSRMRRRLLELIATLPEELGGSWQGGEELSAIAQEVQLAVGLRFGEETFVLAHSMDPELDELLVVESRFGKVPRMLAAECYARLLDVNFRSVATRQTAFALDRESGQVILTTQCPLARLTSEELRTLLNATTIVAQQWRRDFFLASAEASGSFAGRHSFAMQI